MLSFIDKVTIGTSFALFASIVASVVDPFGIHSKGGLAARLAGTLVLSNISEIIQSFVHDKLNSSSQLIKGKSRDAQKLLKYFNGTKTSVSNVLLCIILI